MANGKAGGLKQRLTNVGDAGFSFVMHDASINGTGYSEEALQADEGCDFDFLVPADRGAVPQAHEDIS